MNNEYRDIWNKYFHLTSTQTFTNSNFPDPLELGIKWIWLALDINLFKFLYSVP